ncbi:MAG: hypothetical protein JWL59_2116 [Chthoniobacteraceae bacterium]|nr:hypothetical protein [Chthoniobacteraceae bacterium]
MRRLLPLLLAFLSLAVPGPLSATIVGYWNFDNATQPGQDASGNGYNLTVVGGAAYSAAGKKAGALSLNGAGACLSGAIATLPIGNSTYTVAAWIKPTLGDARGIVGWGNYGNSRQVNALRLNGANGFSHYWWGADINASDAQVTAKGVTLTGGQWVHIVAVYNGTTRSLYLNGQLLVSDAPGVNAAANTNFRIGSTNNGEYFSGLLDDVAIWNNALTAQEIANLAAGASPVAGPQITSFTSTKASAFEGESMQLSWTVDVTKVTGTLGISIATGGTPFYTSANATGDVAVTIPNLSGTAQNITYTLTATETGGNNASRVSQLNIAADPGIPIATPQSGLNTLATTPKAITLAGNDPNGGTLAYLIVTAPAHGVLSGTAPSLSYTATAGYFGPDSFSFKVNDGKYDSAPVAVSISVNSPPAAPTRILLSNSQISTGATSGAFISSISSSDINPDETHTYTLVAGEGGTDNARFSINGHQLRAAQSFAGTAGGTFLIRIRSTDLQGLFVEGAFTLTAAAPLAGVVINEIHFNSVDNTLADQFIELYNAGGVPVNLTGWRISGGVDYSFPSGTTIANGAYLLIAANPAVIQSRWTKTALGPWVGSLSGNGETVRLRNAADLIIGEVDYKVGFPWPIASGGNGASMELINPALDGTLGSSWRASVIPSANATTDTATPGAQNLQFAANAAPNIRQVSHAPLQPVAGTPIVISARVTDPDGVASVQLEYQIVAPGNYIPATLPKPIVNRNIDTSTPQSANPAFATWTTVPMNDDGLAGDTQDGDGIYVGTIPGQPDRSLVRYRLVIADNVGNSIRVPYADDPSLNFACFVYNGVPAYQGNSAAVLQTLPVYQFITRKQDYDDCVAYDVNKQLTGNTPGWTYENWEAAFVYDGVVYDHMHYRLHGANGRYYYAGKRAFRFFFNDGAEFQGRDNDGVAYPGTWKSLVTENCWENRGTLTYCLNEAVNFHLWNQIGIPAPLANWGHFRLLTNAQAQTDQWHGDFWGLIFIHEDYDGHFLSAHNLAKGNLYKLTRDAISGLSQQRYQAQFAVKDGSDHGNIYNNLKGTSTPAFIDAHVNLDQWSRYHALAQAVRHFDYWPNGDNNGAYYFEPTYTAANGNRGKLWILPNDVDATWGPTWNNGRDIVYNSLFNSAGDSGGDAATNPTLWPRYFNAVRELRDLLWQRDQIDPLIEQFAAVIAPFEAADSLRWKNAPADAGNFNGLAGAGIVSLANLVADMKSFAWTGGSWPGGNVGAGGQAAYLDTLQASNGEGAQLPGTPLLTYLGAAKYPVDDLRFQTSAFTDPQGTGTFAALQWRVAEITDPTAPSYLPGDKLKLEWNAAFDSGEISVFNSQFRFPTTGTKPGHTYRARVRHKDNSGRWSHWSAPVQFTTTATDVNPYVNSLVISEFMYHPLPPTAQEAALGYIEDDFEFIEVRNIAAASISLTDVRFTKGIDFDFPAGTQLAPGATILVVRNTAAFISRYGTGKPIAGSYGPDSLKNGGEEVKLSYGAGIQIIDFSYGKVVSWPADYDTAGFSLVLIAPQTRPDPAFAMSWRSSRLSGGTPGGDDRVTFASWGASNGGIVDPASDDDHDGLSNWLEFAFAGNPNLSQPGVLPQIETRRLTINGVEGNYLVISFTRQLGADELVYHVEFSDNLGTWSGNGVNIGSLPLGNGTATETWRSPEAIPAGARIFARVRVTSE